ncbi:dihydrolipoyl dehydrogenase [mine drainage metagenome]|uniref:Dihydrolipoyl dehydrogenase n=1 Tax=mine drainage metagenome TaxID=410659 RepID=A0A1J5S509_9ZZZZ
MSASSFDIVVIGAGPGGYVAAIRAAQLGLRAAVVEREHLGGVCLNWGCIPTKALLASAHVLRQAQHAAAFGVDVPQVSFDLARMVTRSRAVSAQLQAGVRQLLKKNKVAVFEGQGKLAGKGRVSVSRDGKTLADLSAGHIILATGARPRLVPGLEPDGKQVWSYKDALLPPVMPKSLLVVGSGAIGIEFACFYRTLGAEVTVVEVMDRILPAEDAEISELARKSFEKQGIKVLTSATVKGLEKGAGQVTATLAAAGKSSVISAERVIVAVGISPNIESLGLEGSKLRFEKGHVRVNQWLETDEPGLYAIGDLTMPPWLAHKASHEAVICVDKIAGVADVHPLDIRKIPGCTYSHPQIASLGLSEEKAREGGREIRIGRFPFQANGKAIAQGESEGLIKTVFDASTGELLGAHMIGAEVTEMIQGYAIAKTLEATEAELMNTVFPHPTLSEAMYESVLDAYGRVLHS